MTKTDKLRLQRLFNKAYKGLASQGFENSHKGNDDMCAYRGRGKRKCAIGWLIPDEAYKKSFEGKAATEIVILEAAGFKEEEYDFADELQKTHDQSWGAADIKRNLEEFAKKYELTIPKVAV